MDDLLDSEKVLAWLWVIEAMASFKEVGPSLLRDLVQLAPELPDDLGKNTREMIALRCLEDFIAPQNGITSNGPSAEGPKVQFDLSESCEDVLQRILQETSVSDLRVAGSETSKWDIQPFIQHKRACMPKCALEQLKDAILDGSHPYADFLREKSGLTSTSRDDGICRNADNHDSVTSRPNLTCFSDPLVETRNKQSGDNELPSKRDRPDSAAENMAGHFQENCNATNNFDVQHINSKRVKQHSASAMESAERNSVPLHGREPRKESLEMHVPVATVGHASAESEMGTMNEGSVSLHGKGPLKDSSEKDLLTTAEERMVLKDGCDEPTVSKRSQQVDSGEFRKNDSEVPHNAPEPSGAPAAEPVHKIATKEFKHSCENDFQFQEPNSEEIIASEAKQDENSCGEAEMLSDDDGYDNEMTDLANKKHDFLSSQCMADHDSMVVDWTEQNLCMRCNEGGQLLICNTNNCQLVIHEKCVSSPATLDNKGNFYCPFCAYSRAIKEYLEAKKSSSLARKELAAFIRMGSEQQPKEGNDRVNKKSSHCTGGNEDEVSLEKTHENEQAGERGQNEANQVETNVNEDNNPQCQNIIVNNQQAELSSPCNDNVNLEHRAERRSEDNELLHVSASEKEGKENVVKEVPSERRTEGEQDEVPGKNDNISCANNDKDLVNQEMEDLGIHREVLKGQHVDAPKRSVCEFNINSGDEDIDDDDESTTSNYCIRLRGREIPCSFPGTPQSRRKKLPWTVAEEEKLKEGVQKFSDERIIPWKKILEFGESVFLTGRTTMDLKDKWRNMCKGTPKSK